MASRRFGLWYALILMITATLTPLNVIWHKQDRNRVAANNAAVQASRSMEDQLRDAGEQWAKSDPGDRPELMQFLRDHMPGSTVTSEGEVIAIRRGDAVVTTPSDERLRWPSGQLRWDQAPIIRGQQTWERLLRNAREVIWVIAVGIWSLLLLSCLTIRPRATRPHLALLMLAISAGMYVTAFSCDIASPDCFRFAEHIPTGWAAMLAGVSALMLVWSSDFWIRKTDPHPKCDTCGYNLTGNVSGVCPECGNAVSDAR